MEAHSWAYIQTKLKFKKIYIPPCSLVVQSLHDIWLFATPWTAACQASLSFATVILEPKKIKSVTVSIFLPLLPWGDGIGDHNLSFLNVSVVQPPFPLSSFTYNKKLFSFSSLSAIGVVLSVYLSLLVFLLAILTPACDSSSLYLAWCTLHIS